MIENLPAHAKSYHGRRKPPLIKQDGLVPSSDRPAEANRHYYSPNYSVVLNGPLVDNFVYQAPES